MGAQMPVRSTCADAAPAVPISTAAASSTVTEIRCIGPPARRNLSAPEWRSLRAAHIMTVIGGANRRLGSDLPDSVAVAQDLQVMAHVSRHHVGEGPDRNRLVVAQAAGLPLRLFEPPQHLEVGAAQGDELVGELTERHGGEMPVRRPRHLVEARQRHGVEAAERQRTVGEYALAVADVSKQLAHRPLARPVREGLLGAGLARQRLDDRDLGFENVEDCVLGHERHVLAEVFRIFVVGGPHGTYTTPQGRLPTFTLALTVRVARSTIDTSFDGPLAVKSVLPSRDAAMPHGRSPTSMNATGLLVAVSITTTFLPRPVEMNTWVPSGAAAPPMGRISSPESWMVSSTRCFWASTTATEPPFSDVTYARLLSGRKVVDRGRGPTLNVVTSFRLGASITATCPSSSDVTYTTPPSGRRSTPSGSPPTLNVASSRPSAIAIAVARPVSSFATNRRWPSLLTAVCSGSDPAFSTRSSLRSLMLTTPMPSPFLSAGGRVLSSTPGGAMGDPLSAT